MRSSKKEKPGAKPGYKVKAEWTANPYGYPLCDELTEPIDFTHTGRFNAPVRFVAEGRRATTLGH